MAHRAHATPLIARDSGRARLEATTAASDDHKPILAQRFKTKPCKNFQASGACPYEHRCMFAHGADELRTRAQNLADGLTSEDAIAEFRRAQFAAQKQHHSTPHYRPDRARRPSSWNSHAEAARPATPLRSAAQPPVPSYMWKATDSGDHDSGASTPHHQLPSVSACRSGSSTPHPAGHDDHHHHPIDKFVSPLAAAMLQSRHQL